MPFAKGGTIPDLTDEYDGTYTISNVKIVARMAHFEPEAAGDSQNGPLTIPLMAIREVFRKVRSRASSRSPLRIIAFRS
jgi:hypothetical protein